MSVYIKATANGWARTLAFKSIMVMKMKKYFNFSALSALAAVGLGLGAAGDVLATKRVPDIEIAE
jgi:hypothetical protein